MEENGKTKKKLLIIVTIIALLLILAIGTTLAYLTDAKSALNVIGIGKDSNGKQTVSIKLEENAFVQQINDRITAFGSTSGSVTTNSNNEVTSAKIYNLVPNENINKDPVITNTGAEPVYLRIRVLDNAGNDAFTNTVLSGDVATAAGLGLKKASNWVKIGNYYYYSVGGTATGTGTALAVGASDDIFAYIVPATKTSMQVPEKWDYADIPANALDIKIEVQAIQSRSFTPNLAAANPWQYSDNSVVAFAY